MARVLTFKAKEVPVAEFLCNQCKRWKDYPQEVGPDDTQCQDCWEDYCSEEWWKAVGRIQEVNAIAKEFNRDHLN